MTFQSVAKKAQVDSALAVPRSVAQVRQPSTARRSAPKVLLVHANPQSADEPGVAIVREFGIQVDPVFSLAQVQEAIAHHCYSLILLETSAAAYDGLALCRELLFLRVAPVVVWTSGEELMDRVAALDLGAEDVIAKSIHPSEFAARVRAALRRASVMHSDDPASALHPPTQWIFSPRDGSFTSQVSGRRVWLSPKLSILLTLLCRNIEQRLDREELGRALMAATCAPGVMRPRSVDVVVSRLRRCLDQCEDAGGLIRTVRPTGYVLDAKVALNAEGVFTLTGTPTTAGKWCSPQDLAAAATA